MNETLGCLTEMKEAIEILRLRLESKLCCCRQGNGERCKNRGKTEKLGFCGTHSKKADILFELTLSEISLELGVQNLSTADLFNHLSANRSEYENALLRVESEMTHNFEDVRIGAEDLKEALLVTEAQLIQAKKLWSKCKGTLESKFFQIIEEEIKARIEPYRGELTMTGPNCLKILKNVDKLLTLVEDQSDFQSWKLFFHQFNLIAGFLMSTQPLRSIDLYQSEHEMLEGPVVMDEDISPLLNDLDFITILCREHGDLYPLVMAKTQTPKHHFLIYHVPQFLARTLSVGMLSEQACERSHAGFNSLNRKLKPMNVRDKMERRFKERIHQSSYPPKNSHSVSLHLQRSSDFIRFPKEKEK